MTRWLGRLAGVISVAVGVGVMAFPAPGGAAPAQRTFVIAGVGAFPVGGASGTIVVKPGHSIQAAVDEASPGDTILVFPGTYHEAGTPCPADPATTCAVAIAKDDINLVGLSDGTRSAVLENAGGQDTGIEVARTGDPSCLTDPTERVHGSLVYGFTVRGFAGNGVELFCAVAWRVSGVKAKGDAVYGIYPSHVGPGRVDHSFAAGANDTGIYIGQSHGVRIDHNTATGNVSGFEIENSTGVRADDNLATGNTGGILSFVLPFLDVKVNSDNRIDHNVVTKNNRPNTCLEPGDDVCLVPRGAGILMVGPDTNEVDHNRVTGNHSFGIALVNVCTAFGLTVKQCNALDVDPSPDGNHIVSNRVLGNGSKPDPGIKPFPGADLLWDFTGVGNCWADNTFKTEFPGLPAC